MSCTAWLQTTPRCSKHCCLQSLQKLSILADRLPRHQAKSQRNDEATSESEKRGKIAIHHLYSTPYPTFAMPALRHCGPSPWRTRISQSHHSFFSCKSPPTRQRANRLHGSPRHSVIWVVATHRFLMLAVGVATASTDHAWGWLGWVGKKLNE